MENPSTVLALYPVLLSSRVLVKLSMISFFLNLFLPLLFIPLPCSLCSGRLCCFLSSSVSCCKRSCLDASSSKSYVFCPFLSSPIKERFSTVTLRESTVDWMASNLACLLLVFVDSSKDFINSLVQMKSIILLTINQGLESMFDCIKVLGLLLVMSAQSDLHGLLCCY